MINLRPENFKKDPYGFATNQISHVAISFLAAYLTKAPLIIAGIWLLWELYHLYLSRDIADFFEDLFFEVSGAAILLFQPWLWAVGLVLAWGIVARSK